MFIKHFTVRKFRTRDPLHPGQWVVDRRLVGSGTTSIVHAGNTYAAGVNDWFDVPEEVGTFMARFPGWRTDAEVDEDVMAGYIDENDAPSAAPPVPIKPRRERVSS